MPARCDYTLVAQWKPYKENDMPALVPADRGRVSKTQNRADSEMDPDLWLWESIFFKQVSLDSIGAYRGFVKRNWAQRMKTRGFADVRRAKKYPSVHTQNQAIKATHFLAWGQAGHDAPSDRQWGMHCATRLDNQIGTLPPSHPRCREATRAQKGSIATQTHNQGCNFEEKCTKAALLPPSCTRALYMRFRRKMGLEKNHLAKIHFQLAKAQEMLKCELDARTESKVREEKMKKLKDERLETRKKLAKAKRTKKRLEKTLKKFKTKKTAPLKTKKTAPLKTKKTKKTLQTLKTKKTAPLRKKK